MNAFRRRWVLRQIRSLRAAIPGATDVRLSWMPVGKVGWRVAVVLDPKYVLANEQNLAGWSHWPDGWSLGGGRSLRRAFRVARESAASIQSWAACPTCGAIRVPSPEEG